MSDEITFDKETVKKGYKKAESFFKRKDVQIILTIVVLALIIFVGTSIRTKNLDLLKDQTTGEHIPLALDPFYFLRIAETLVQNQGHLETIDPYRQPVPLTPYSHEILPKFVYWGYQLFGSETTTLQYLDVISPVVFFALGILVFFFLVLFLTKSKPTALISSGLLAVIPSYLQRTIAGFADHESIGIFAFFLGVLIFALAIKSLDRSSKKPFLKAGLLGLATAFFTAFSYASWGGLAKFLFMIIPLSFLLLWLVSTKNRKELDKKKLQRYMLFYGAWFILTPILSSLIFGFSFSSVLNVFALKTNSLITAFALLFIIGDYFVITKGEKILKKEIKYRLLTSFIVSLIAGIILLAILGSNPFSLIGGIIGKLTTPFGAGRVGETVAENAATSVKNWVSQTGKLFFWTFYIGLLFLGAIFVKGVQKQKHRRWLMFLWILMVTAMIFTNLSSGSVLNGKNFFSQFLYIGSIIAFIIGFLYAYNKGTIHLEKETIVLVAWTFFMLIAARSAIRLFFIVTPTIAFIGGYTFTRARYHFMKSKDDVVKLILGIVTVFVIVAIIVSFFSFTSFISAQAKVSGPSATPQWQGAMKWVRENTPEGSIFAHWWDYGYWVQTLGERPTVADGGHFEGGYRDHLIGRYLLTTPEPDSALSFMKTNNISYLLIDQSDIGKYGAYSRIGGDETGKDRTSFIPVIPLDDSQTHETRNTTVRIYNGGFALDEDIIIEQNGTQVLFAQNNAGIVGFIISSTIQNGRVAFEQPKAVLVKNQQQYTIPVRYLYFQGQFVDFETGIESAVRITPSLTNQGTSVNAFGSVVYLSKRTFNSLVGQLYLLDDPQNLYPGVSIAHTEQNSVVNVIKLQASLQDDFIYYGGLKGPIKIWAVNPPANILTHEEFLRSSGAYAEFDSLQYRL